MTEIFHDRLLEQADAKSSRLQLHLVLRVLGDVGVSLAVQYRKVSLV